MLNFILFFLSFNIACRALSALGPSASRANALKWEGAGSACAACFPAGAIRDGGLGPWLPAASEAAEVTGTAGRGAVARPRPRSLVPVSVPGASRALPVAAQVSGAGMRRGDAEPAGKACRPRAHIPGAAFDRRPGRNRSAWARRAPGAARAGFAAATGAAGWTSRPSGRWVAPPPPLSRLP